MIIVGNYFTIPGLESFATSRINLAIESSSIEEVIDAAAVTATAPGPTHIIQDSIVKYAVSFKDLYEGEKCAFSKLVAVNMDLGTEIAKEERARSAKGKSVHFKEGSQYAFRCAKLSCGRFSTGASIPGVSIPCPHCSHPFAVVIGYKPS